MNIILTRPKHVITEGSRVIAVEFTKQQLITALRKAEHDRDADLYEPKKMAALLRRKVDPKNLPKNLVKWEDLKKELGV